MSSVRPSAAGLRAGAALLALVLAAPPAPAQSVWTNTSADNQWGTATNWNPSGAPNAAAVTAAFNGGGLTNGTGTVNLGGAFTVGTLQLSAGNYNFGGAGRLTLTNLTNSAGTNTIANPLTANN